MGRFVFSSSIYLWLLVEELIGKSSLLKRNVDFTPQNTQTLGNPYINLNFLSTHIFLALLP